MKWQRLSCETRSHVKSIPDLKRTVRFIHIYTVCPPCHEIWSQNPLVSAHHASFHLRLAFYKWMPAPFPALHSRAKLRSDWYLKLYLFFTLYISLLFGQFENRSASAVESLFQKQSANKSSWPSSFQQFFPIQLFPLLFVPLANAPHSLATTPFLQRGVGSFYSLTWFEPRLNKTGPGPIPKPQKTNQK